jgi:hypothetical protein
MLVTGAVPPFSFPRVPLDYTLHNDDSVVLDYLRGKLADPQSAQLAQIFIEIECGDIPLSGMIFPGDLLALKVGRAVHHLAVALDEDHFIHCLPPIGVSVQTVRDHTYSRILQTLFRATAK